MSTRSKYWLVYCFTAFLVILVVLGVLGLFWSDLSPDERIQAWQLGPKLTVYALTGLVANLFLFSSMLGHFFKSYITPLVKLSEETQLIAVANAKYRIAPKGAAEVLTLTEAINELAAKHIALKTDVQQIVQYSRQGLSDEKQRLVALMAQIPEGVIVCNVDGRILLYNHRAQSVIDAPPSASEGDDLAALHASPALGLGRSIFGVIDRRPILHALNYLQKQLNRGKAHPSFNFTTTRRNAQFLRVRIAPVATSPKGSDELEGYVLSVHDITHRLRAESHREIFLQSLGISLQRELSQIKAAADHLMKDHDFAGSDVAAHGHAIHRQTVGLIREIDQVVRHHAARLRDPEYMLGVDLISVIRETLAEESQVKVTARAEEDLWLNANSYTAVQGTTYLVGQLHQRLSVEHVNLRLDRQGSDGVLTVEWSGDPVPLDTIYDWAERPLTLGATDPGPASLSNMLEGRSVPASVSAQVVSSVRFTLAVEEPRKGRKLEAPKEHRPVYYEFDLFDPKHQRTDHEDVPLRQLTFVIFDTETTGLDPSGGDEIISIGAIRAVGGKLRREEVFDQLVDPRRSIPLESLKIHEIFPEMLRGMPTLDKVLPQFHEFATDAVLVAHNAAFDMRFLEIGQKRAGVKFDHLVLDTLLLSAVVHPHQEPHTLDAVAERFGLPIIGRHTALGDAILTGEILLKLIPLLEAQGIHTLREAWLASKETRYSMIEF